MVYSGNLVRQAHYERYTPVQGIDPLHTHEQPGRGMFEPTPEAGTAPAPGSVWTPRDPTPHTDAVVREASHWENSTARPVRSGVDQELADTESDHRMVAAHAHQAYSPETYPRYRSNASRSIEWTDGRRPIQPNVDAFLVGPNGYDLSNPPSDVYGGDRYRVGTDNHIWGEYRFWQKQGQEAWLRPVVGEYPQLPVDKPAIADPAPYSPSSSGTARWRLPSFQQPRMFTTPSETGMSDFAMAQTDLGSGFAEFEEGGRL